MLEFRSGGNGSLSSAAMVLNVDRHKRRVWGTEAAVESFIIRVWKVSGRDEKFCVFHGANFMWATFIRAEDTPSSPSPWWPRAALAPLFPVGRGTFADRIIMAAIQRMKRPTNYISLANYFLIESHSRQTAISSTFRGTRWGLLA